MSLVGYLYRQSAGHGEDVRVMARSDQPFSVQVSPLLDPKQIVYELTDVRAKRAADPKEAFATGCQWDETFRFTIGANWPTGAYAIRLVSGPTTFVIPFALKPGAAARSKNLVVMNTNTWQAYNLYGGSSFYRYAAKYDTRWGLAGRKRGSRWASLHRPNPTISDDAIRLWKYLDLIDGRMGAIAEGRIDPTIQPHRVDHLLFQEALGWSWLKANGIEFDLTTDHDLHRQRIPATYENVILICHPEYWSEEMWENVRRHVGRGGNLISLAGNVVHRRIAFGGGLSNLRIMKQSIERDGVATQLWTDPGDRNLPPLKKVGQAEPGRVVGSCYDNRAYNTYAPYRITRPDHWVFEGCDTDAPLGLANFNGKGASGHETDTSCIGPGPVLAEGTNGPGGGHIMYHTIGEAKIFSVGSLAFCGSLHVCPSTARMTKNVMQRFGV